MAVMHSTVAHSPRTLHGLAKSQISLSHEVSVTSTPSEVPYHNMNSINTTPSLSQALHRAVSGHSRRQTGTFSDHDLSHLSADLSKRARISRDAAGIERNRQNMRELAAFLKTNQPPPDHFMSISESTENLDTTKKLPFKLFRRQKSKSLSNANSRLMRLPDSAVAAKTVEGHWHIAISIPLDYDGPYRQDVPPYSVPRPATAHGMSDGRTGPITVLKPVVPDQPSVPNEIGEFQQCDGLIIPSPLNLGERRRPPSPPVLGADAASTLQNYYRQERLEEEIALPTTIQSTTSSATNVERRGFVPVSPAAMSRQDSQRTDPRHSGGTSYSARSLDTDVGHSRVPSTTSMMRNSHHFISLRGIEPPIRSSSMPKSASLNTPILSMIDASPASNDVLASNSDKSTTPLVDSLDPDTSSASATAAKTGPRESKGFAMSSDFSPRRPRTPAQKLPALQETPDDGQIVSSPSGRMKGGIPLPGERWSKLEAGLGTPLRTRQERVKALRARDMLEARQAESVYQQAHMVNAAKANQIDVLESSTKLRSAVWGPRRSKRRSLSSSPTHRERHCISENSVSPIMLVADLEPHVDSIYANDGVFSVSRHNLRKTRSSNTNRSSLHKVHTPPRSLNPSLASSEEDDGRIRTYEQFRSSPSLSPDSAITSPQQKRDSPRRKVHEGRELDRRLRRIERSNAAMLQTLNAVVQMGTGFRDLKRLLPAASSDVIDASLFGQLSLEAIEPLMRELQLAARISQESKRSDDEGDGECHADDEAL